MSCVFDTATIGVTIPNRPSGFVARVALRGSRGEMGNGKTTKSSQHCEKFDLDTAQFAHDLLQSLEQMVVKIDEPVLGQLVSLARLEAMRLL
jgi:hypothetical protein